MSKFHEINEKKHIFDFSRITGITSVNIDSISGKWDNSDLTRWTHELFDPVFGDKIIDSVLRKIDIISENDWKKHLIVNGQIDNIIGFVTPDGIVHLPSNSSFHTAVHETLHKISDIKALMNKEKYIDSKGDERRITGIREFYPDGLDTNMMNETLTEYLTSKYTDNQIFMGSMYDPKNVDYWKRIDDTLFNLYGDSNILLKCYISNDIEFLKKYFDKYIYKNSYVDFASYMSEYYKKDNNKKMNKLITKLENNINQYNIFKSKNM